jgi:3-phosphoshikimate 1-carboxyvinyltransferase
MIVKPAKNVLGAVRLPGDKSISHRYAILASIATGVSRFQNFSSGEDCASTLRCIEALGAKVRRAEGGAIEIEGNGPKLRAPDSVLDCGNSGSTMRMLAGIVAGQEFSSELAGDESLSRRPMARVVEPLTRMGTHVQASEGGKPPLRISGGRLTAIDYAMPVASAQVKSAVSFAALFAKGTTTVEEPLRTRDHGELALRAFGAEVQRSKNRVSIAGGQPLSAITAAIPGDISSAAFFMCAAAIFPGSNLVFDDLLLNPTRAGLLDVLSGLGARISVINLQEHHGELVGTVKVEHGRLKSAKISGAQSAALIDELPVLAAIAPFTEGGIEVRDARELRVKESDRIATIANGLRAMGAVVEEFDDGFRIPGGQQLHGAEVDSAGDHRIAMALSIAAIKGAGETNIRGAEAVAISFPQFFDILHTVAEQ